MVARGNRRTTKMMSIMLKLKYEMVVSLVSDKKGWSEQKFDIHKSWVIPEMSSSIPSSHPTFLTNALTPLTHNNPNFRARTVSIPSLKTTVRCTSSQHHQQHQSPR